MQSRVPPSNYDDPIFDIEITPLVAIISVILIALVIAFIKSYFPNRFENDNEDYDDFFYI